MSENTAPLGRAAGAGAGEPDRGEDYTEDPLELLELLVRGGPRPASLSASCIVCGDNLTDLNPVSDPNRLLCSTCRGRADHHNEGELR